MTTVNELLAIADEYEVGTAKCLASGYIEYGPEFQRKRRLIIEALRSAAAPAQCARNDLGIVLSALRYLEEATGEKFDDEGGIIAQIERDYSAVASTERPLVRPPLRHHANETLEEQEFLLKQSTVTSTERVEGDQRSSPENAYGVSRHPGPWIGPDAELARACAIAAIKDYGTDDPDTHQRIMRDGVWNDHVAVQAALAAIYYFRQTAPAQQPASPETAVWHPIETAPFQRTVILSRLGESLCVTAYRIGSASGWRHAHSSEKICFEPTHWMDLPEPPVAL